MLQNTLPIKWKDNAQNGRKHLQIIYLIRDLYPEYIENSQLNNNKKKKSSSFKMGNGLKLTFPRENIQMANSTWKDAPHH